MSKSFRELTNIIILVVWFAPILAVCGCNDVDWNSELTWWRQPRRVVRPSQTESPSRPRAETEVARDAQQPKTSTSAPSAPDNQIKQAVAEDAPQSPVESQAPARPFYQVYLCTGQQEGRADDGEFRLNLKHASGRACGTLLEMLYVPIGRSGSAADTFLLYRERAEFVAAQEFAPKLDIEPQASPLAEATVASAFEEGVARFLRIIEDGAVVNPKLVQACQAILADAAKHADIDERTKWAAAVFAGRLASDYRYDYASAGKYYGEATKIARPDSLERMTALWWTADCLFQEGKFSEADGVLTSIISEFENRWPDSQIVQKTKAILKESRKR